MSAEMIAANSTSGLQKLTKAEEKQAKAGNAGKHMQNAAGHALHLRRKDGLAPKRRRTDNTKKVPSTRTRPRAPRSRVARAPPNQDPMPLDLDGYGPLPIGVETGLQLQYDNQHVWSLVGASPNLPMELPPTFYGNTFNTSFIPYDQFAPSFVPSMSAYGTESMLGEQELNLGDDFIDWYGGESDGLMEEIS